MSAILLLALLSQPVDHPSQSFVENRKICLVAATTGTTSWQVVSRRDFDQSAPGEYDQEVQGGTIWLWAEPASYLVTAHTFNGDIVSVESWPITVTARGPPAPTVPTDPPPEAPTVPSPTNPVLVALTEEVDQILDDQPGPADARTSVGQVFLDAAPAAAEYEVANDAWQATWLLIAEADKIALSPSWQPIADALGRSVSAGATDFRASWIALSNGFTSVTTQEVGLVVAVYDQERQATPRQALAAREQLLDIDVIVIDPDQQTPDGTEPERLSKAFAAAKEQGLPALVLCTADGEVIRVIPLPDTAEEIVSEVEKG